MILAARPPRQPHYLPHAARFDRTKRCSLRNNREVTPPRGGVTSDFDELSRVVTVRVVGVSKKFSFTSQVAPWSVDDATVLDARIRNSCERRSSGQNTYAILPGEHRQ